MTESSKPRFSIVSVLVPMVAFGLGVWLGINMERKNPVVLDPTETTPVTLKSTANALAMAEGFVDADGDLVADAPSDPAKQVDPDVIYFSWLGVKNAAKEFKPAFKGFMEGLAKATGKRVEYVDIENEAGQLDAFKDGKLHLTCFNTGLVPQAVREGGFVPVAQPSRGENVSAYKMEIIVPAGSKVTKVADIKGKTIYFTTPESNSGFKAPLVILGREFGMHSPSDFTYKFSGGHEASVIGVSTGQYEAAAIANTVLERMVSQGFSGAKVKSIYASAPFPQAVLGMAYNLKPELAQKIKAFVLGYDMRADGLDKALNETGFVPVDYKGQWATIREIDQAFGGQQ